MGQFMEALNNPTNLEDLGFNIDGFQGGLECNVEEVNDFFLVQLKIIFLKCKSLFPCRSFSKNSISMDS